MSAHSVGAAEPLSTLEVERQIDAAAQAEIVAARQLELCLRSCHLDGLTKSDLCGCITCSMILWRPRDDPAIALSLRSVQ